MQIYYVIFGILAFLACFDLIGIKKSQRELMLGAAAVMLVLFAGLRWDSPDYMAYCDGFEDVRRNGLNYAELGSARLFEPGYNLIAWATGFFSSSPVALFLVVAAIAVGLNAYLLQRYTSYFLLALLLYFVHTYLLREHIQIRSGVAAAICFYSLRWVRSERPWRFLATVGAAMSFHLASGVFLLVYPVYRLGWSPGRWKKICLACLVVAYALPLGKFLSLIPFVASFERVSNYMWTAGLEPSGVLTNPTILKQGFFVFAGLTCWNELSARLPCFRVIFIPMLLSFCWLLVWNDFPIVANRMATFFSVTEVVLVPNFLCLLKPRSRPVVFLCIVVFAFLVLYLNLQGGNVKEYKSIVGL